MLLKHAAVSSQQQPMTASTISSLEHSAEYIIRPVSGQANPPRLSFPFFLYSRETRSGTESLGTSLPVHCSSAMQASAGCSQLFQQYYTVDDPLDSLDGPVLFSLRVPVIQEGGSAAEALP